MSQHSSSEADGDESVESLSRASTPADASEATSAAASGPGALPYGLGQSAASLEISAVSMSTPQRSGASFNTEASALSPVHKKRPRRHGTVIELWRAYDGGSHGSMTYGSSSTAGGGAGSGGSLAPEYTLLARFRAQSEEDCRAWAFSLRSTLKYYNETFGATADGVGLAGQDATTAATNKEAARHQRKVDTMMVLWREKVLPALEAGYIRTDVWKPSSLLPVSLRDLVAFGVPPSLRGRVWPLAIGNPLKVTPELYMIYQERARAQNQRYLFESTLEEDDASGAAADPHGASRRSHTTGTSATGVGPDTGGMNIGREESLRGIGMDLPRTLPRLSLFGKRGEPFYQQLREVLEVFTCYRPDVGYVQGMSYLAANLCLCALLVLFLLYVSVAAAGCRVRVAHTHLPAPFEQTSQAPSNALRA